MIRPRSSIMADIAGMQPAVDQHARAFGLVTPIAGHDAFAAHENLAILGNPDLGALHRRADRSMVDPGLGAVARDDRAGLGLAIALQHGEPERAEEAADFGIERRAARDQRLHPPAEALAAPWGGSWRRAAGRAAIVGRPSCRSFARASASALSSSHKARPPCFSTAFRCGRAAARTGAARRS
jgi:hypothetical protein